MRKSRKAVLNLVSALLDQGLVLLTSFLLAPQILQHLGSAHYGFWLFIQKTLTQAAMLDGRCAEVLKWKIARQNESTDYSCHQREIGASLISTAFFVPIVIFVLTIFLVVIPKSDAASGVTPTTVKCTVLFLSLNLFVCTASEFLNAILRGMNLGFRRMGVRGSVTVVGGVISYVLLSNNYGLPTLAVVTLATSVVGTLALFAVVRSNLPWARPARPEGARVRANVQQSAGFSLASFVSVGIITLDHFLVGIFLNSVAVADYSLTKFLPNLIPVLAANVYAALIPGFSGNIAKKNLSLVARLHEDSINLSTVVAVSLFAPVFALNKYFVQTWVGGSHYAGIAVSALVIMGTAQQLSIQYEQTLLSALMIIRKRIYMGALALVVMVAMALILVPWFGLAGICVAVVTSRGLLLVQLQQLSCSSLKVENSRFRMFFKTQLVPTIIIVVLTLLQGILPTPDSIVDAVLYSCGYLMFGLLIGWLVLLSSEQRRTIASRIRTDFKPS
jgi:O-antigen/teichoic acid export membrane protein